MPLIELVTDIAAPIERVFDFARSIDVHQESQAKHGEKVVAGRTAGLIEAGETVTWEATHFGIRQHFEEIAGGTRMTDVFDYRSPFGPLGRLADWLFLERYMRRLLEERNQVIRRLAEAFEGE